MQIERVVLQGGDQSVTLDLHPRLTVVAGMGRIERHSLIGEIIGSLGGSRTGVHVELERRDGRHLAVFRPANKDHRVIDIGLRTDVTAEFAAEDGSCDLLAAMGLDADEARRVMRLDAAGLAADSHHDDAVASLAGLDQRRVWAAAEALSAAEGDLTTEAEAMGSAPEDADVIEEIESAHAHLERAADGLEATRRRTFWIGSVATIATIPCVVLAGPVGMLSLVVAVLSVLASLAARERLERAGRAEMAALERAGASSYLGFQIQRVNGLLGDDAGRRALMGVAGARRSALAAWQQLAGDIPVEWALGHREEITAAAQLRRDVDALGVLSSTMPTVSEETTSELAQALVGRLAQCRAVAGEGLPLLLDDAFCDLDPSVKPLLLELLGRSAGRPQIVFLTEDEDVASWARLEALTGAVALVEPSIDALDSDDRRSPARA